MKTQRATAKSWKIRPIPADSAELLLDGTYTLDDYTNFERGFVPQTAADKWFIYLEDNILSFHRSQTGTLVFALHLDPQPDHIKATKVVANRDSSQYRTTSDEFDVQLLAYLIDTILLGRSVPLPSPTKLNHQQQTQHALHVIGTAQPPQPKPSAFINIDKIDLN